MPSLTSGLLAIFVMLTLVTQVMEFVNPYWATLSYLDGEVVYRSNMSDELVAKLDDFFQKTRAYRRYPIQRIGYERGLYHVALVALPPEQTLEDYSAAGLILGPCLAYAVFQEPIEVHFVEPKDADELSARFQVILVEPDEKTCQGVGQSK